MESENFSSSGLYWLCKEAENRSTAADSPAPEIPAGPKPDSQVGGDVPAAEAPPTTSGEKRRRGRPLKVEGKEAPSPAPPVKRRKKKEDEDVCFICFDGGSLVLCDQGDCPKAYHPACIKRDEAFFSSNARWTCGWHICSKCQKSAARYMCYTCTYSLCRGCSSDDDFLSVRGNKGFCSTCFPVVRMIENIDQGNNDTVQVDFDDKLSWEYLFKVYWICLKRDLSLTVDEITRAQKPSIVPNKVARRKKSSAVYYPGNNGSVARENPTTPSGEISYASVKSVRDNGNNNPVVSTAWASKELLNFVAYMRNGDASALSQKEVQTLLFDHIKRNNLRDPHQRSEIICDSELENLFGKPRVRHFEMLSLLEFHFITKDESRKDEIEGGNINPVVRQVTNESNGDNLPIISENYRHKVDKKDEDRVDINRVNEENDTCEKLDNHVESSGSTNKGPNNQTCLQSEALSGVKSETSASLSTGSTPSANDREAENSWHYRDPNGKVQGPFGIEQLYKWSSTGIFPTEMRVWRLNTEECESVLLADVIKGQVPLQNNLSSSPQEAKGTPDSTSHQCDGPWNGSASSAGIDIDAHSNGKLEFVKCNAPVPHSSNLTTPTIYENPQLNGDAQLNNSSKCSDPDASKVINSYPNPSQVHSVEQASPFTEQPHKTSVHHDSSNARQTWNSTPNYENWNSQENMASQSTGRECHKNQVNEQHYLGHSYSEGSLHQNTSVNNWNSHEAQPHYASMANLNDSSEQKFSIDLQELPMPMPKSGTGVLVAQTIKEQQRWQPQQVSVQNLNVQNVLGLTSKSSDHEEREYFGGQKTASLTDNFEKIPATENKHSLSPNYPARDFGTSWTSASTLVPGAGSHLPKKVNKPSMVEWDSGFLSASSLRPHEVANDHVATPSSGCNELPPSSPPNPVPNASSWLAMMTEPIEFNTLAEESVSDLLAEVDAMESNSDVASPNMLMDYVDDLFDDSKTDCFSSLRGLSNPLGREENHGLSSSGDIMFPPQSSRGDEQNQAADNDELDPMKKSKRHSSTSFVVKVETKQFGIPANQFESGSHRDNPSPPKKTRDLADILNASVKHGNLNSAGSIHCESGQGTTRGSGSKNRSTWGGISGRESSHQKHGGERLTSPRERHVSGLTSPRDRNVPGGDSGSKERHSWIRQSSFGSGGGGSGSGSHSRSLPRGQRVCKFHENGNCRKGAFCEYLHP